MKKVAIIDHVGQRAGMDYYSSSLAKGFVDNDAACLVLSNFVGMDANRIDYKPFFSRNAKSGRIQKVVVFLSALLRSSWFCKQAKVDLVIVHLFSANLVSFLLLLIPKLFGCKVAVIAHDISSFVNHDKDFIQNAIYNRLSDYIVVHNKYSYHALFDHVYIKRKNKVVVIKHGGYLDHIGEPLSKQDARKALGLEVDAKYMLFFGQIKDVKGLDILIEAMVDTPKDIKLIIAGKPWESDFSFYDALITKHCLVDRVVKIIRFIEDDEREKLFFAANVNVLPYRIIFQSGVLLMAMSHGLPVIASDLPANKEIIVHGENGLLFQTENVEALAAQMISFFQSEEVNEHIASQALETIQTQYAWKAIAQQYLDKLV